VNPDKDNQAQENYKIQFYLVKFSIEDEEKKNDIVEE
jgi:hypothetical protein